MYRPTLLADSSKHSLFCEHCKGDRTRVEYRMQNVLSFLTYLNLSFCEFCELFWSPDVRRLSVRQSVYLIVNLSVNFSHFHLLLQNQKANFNQTWHKASLRKGDSSFSNEGPRPFPSGDNCEKAKIH